MRQIIKDIIQFENWLGIKLPDTYKKYILKSDIQIRKVIIDNEIISTRFLTFDTISENNIIKIFKENRDFMLAITIPIAHVEYGDYICLFYFERDRESQVYYWNYELSIEDVNKSYTKLCHSFDEFLNFII